MLAFIASHEACRRIAVFSIQLTRNPCQTGEPWHLLCHGGKTPANLYVPLAPCAPAGAQSGVQGLSPCLFADAEAGEDVVEKLLVYAVASDAAQKIKGFVQVDGGKIEGCAGGKAGLSLTETVRRLPGQSHVPLLHQLPLVGLA